MNCLFIHARDVIEGIFAVLYVSHMCLTRCYKTVVFYIYFENRLIFGKIMNEKYRWSFLTHSVDRVITTLFVQCSVLPPAFCGYTLCSVASCLPTTATATTKITQKRRLTVFSCPRSESWPHHGRTFSIYLYPLSF